MQSASELKVDEHREKKGYRVVEALTHGFLFTSFLLFLLVSLSLPIIKPIYLLRFQSTTATASELLSLSTQLRFGVWGVCASSTLAPPTTTSNPGPCFGPMLGYTVPADLAAVANIPPVAVTVVEKTLIGILVLHPIAAGLSALSILLAVLFYSHRFSIIVLIISIITALVSSVALAIDLALVIVAKTELANIQGLQFEILFGNAVWMILGAVTATWLAVLTLSMRACYCLGRYRYHPRHHHHHHHRPTEHY